MSRALLGGLACFVLAVSCGDDAATTTNNDRPSNGAGAGGQRNDAGANSVSLAGTQSEAGSGGATEVAAGGAPEPATGGAGGMGGAAAGAAGMPGAAGAPDALANSSTGTWTTCPAVGACNAECTGSREPALGNCMVFVNSRYSMSVFGSCGDENGIGVVFNGGMPPAAGKTYTVAGLLDFSAGKASISHTTGPGSTQEFGTSGTITVLPGLPVTAQFTDVDFPSGVTISGEIICH